MNILLSMDSQSSELKVSMSLSLEVDRGIRGFIFIIKYLYLIIQYYGKFNLHYLFVDRTTEE